MNLPVFFKYSVFITIGLCLIEMLLDLPFGYFFITLGFLSFAFAIAILVNRALQLRKYERAPATVIDIIEKQEQFKNENKSYPVYYPVVTFTTYLGKKITHQITEGIYPAPEEGKILPIAYNPDELTEIILVDTNYLIEFIFGGVGLLFMIIGTCAVVF